MTKEKINKMDWDTKVEYCVALCKHPKQLMVVNALLVVGNEVGDAGDAGKYLEAVERMLDDMLESEYIPLYYEFYKHG